MFINNFARSLSLSPRANQQQPQQQQAGQNPPQQQPANPQALTLAPQGDFTTQAIGEEGGTVTTLATNEEGGSPVSRALDEAGISTLDALSVINRADSRPQNVFLRPDGKLSREELSNFISKLQNSKTPITPNSPNDRHLRAAQFLLSNFDAIGSTDELAQGGAFGILPNRTISIQDVNTVSRRDGNPFNITWGDVQNLPSKPKLIESVSTPTVLAVLKQVNRRGGPKESDGVVTKDELKAYIEGLDKSAVRHNGNALLWDAAHFLLQNFEAIAQADTRNPAADLPPNAGLTISEQDIKLLVGRDGNRNNLSLKDLGKIQPPPPPPPPPPPTLEAIATEQAIQILKAADTRGNILFPTGPNLPGASLTLAGPQPLSPAIGPDGKLSRDELEAFIKQLEERIKVEDLAGPSPTQPQLDAARFLLKNFDAIARADAFLSGAFIPDMSTTISLRDIELLASRDGNAKTLTQKEINLGPLLPDGPPPPTGFIGTVPDPSRPQTS
jgi:hypothetical protein